MKQGFAVAITLAIVIGALFGCAHEKQTERRKSWTPEIPQEVTIRDAWQGDYPVRDLGKLPPGQREARVGYIQDANTFASVWQAFKPDEDIPTVDFTREVAIFSRNVRFYNRTRITRVALQDGVLEVLAAETMSALPIEEKVAMAMAIIPRKGIKAMQTGEGEFAVTGLQ